MAYGELNDVTCPVFLFGTDYTYRHSTFRIDDIAWKYRKTANIIEKTSVYHTVYGDPAHCFTHRKPQK